MTPRVSVVITTYNQAPYIGDTIRSALAQTYTDREVVVIDDGSSDGTADVVAQFGSAVRLIRQANRGVAGARNRGVSEARGELLAFLDGDDLWEPTKLARQVAILDRHSDVGLVAGDVLQFDGDRVLWARQLRREIFAGSAAPYVVDNFYRRFVYRNAIATTSQVMMPAAVYRQLGPSREDLRTGSDYDLYLRIARHYPLAFLNEVLTRWRYLPSSASGPGELRELQWTSDDLEILCTHIDEPTCLDRSFVEQRIRELERDVSWMAYVVGCNGDPRVGRQYLWRVIKRRRGWRPAAYYAATCLPGPVRRLVTRTGKEHA